MTTASQRPTAFYGRRKGHRLRDRQSALMTDVLPALRVPADQQSALASLFPEPVEAVWLEIGFGGGEHLATQLKVNPTVGIIGCEPFVNGVAKLLASEPDTRRLRIHDADVAELLPRLPGQSLARVFILYPDPWPKRRQRKRRLVSAEMLTALASVMKPGAELRFATDIDDYAAWTLSRVMASGAFDWAAERATDWTQPWAEWSSTRYEQKALREGRVPSYFTFIRR